MYHWTLVAILFFMTVLLGVLTSAISEPTPYDAAAVHLCRFTVGALFGGIAVYAWGERKGR